MESISKRTTQNDEKLYTEMVKATVEGFKTYFEEQHSKVEADVATRTPSTILTNFVTQ